MQESLEALQSLPEATLFDETAVSPVWLEVVDRSARFLRQVVLGYVQLVLPTASSSVKKTNKKNYNVTLTQLTLDF